MGWRGQFNINSLDVHHSVVFKCMVRDLKVAWCIFGYSNDAKESLEQFGSLVGIEGEG